MSEANPLSNNPTPQNSDNLIRVGLILLFSMLLSGVASMHSPTAVLFIIPFCFISCLQVLKLDRWHFLHISFLLVAIMMVDTKLAGAMWIYYSLVASLLSKRGVYGVSCILVGDLLSLPMFAVTLAVFKPEVWPLTAAVTLFLRSLITSRLPKITGWKLEIGAMSGYGSLVAASLTAGTITACFYLEDLKLSPNFLVQITFINVIAFALLLKFQSSFQMMRQGILGLCNLLHYAHPYTSGHSKRVAGLARETGRRIGLPEWKLDQVVFAALLHDIGKVAIDERILEKPGKLDDQEFAEIKKHPVTGESILKPLSDLGNAHNWIRHHHERVDGCGYPDKEQDLNIPLESKLICVIDAFDAMTDNKADGHRRLYREPYSVEKALGELQRCAGTQFDPEIVRIFEQVVRESEPLPDETVQPTLEEATP